MDNNFQQRGLSGHVKVIFAIPTDDSKKWRMKNGSVTFEKGATASLDVTDGYIPHFKGSHGLTVTYCVFRGIRKMASGYIGDVTMMTCINGLVMSAEDIADNVEVVPLKEMPAALAGMPTTTSGALT